MAKRNGRGLFRIDIFFAVLLLCFSQLKYVSADYLDEVLRIASANDDPVSPKSNEINISGIIKPVIFPFRELPPFSLTNNAGNINSADISSDKVVEFASANDDPLLKSNETDISDHLKPVLIHPFQELPPFSLFDRAGNLSGNSSDDTVDGSGGDEDDLFTNQTTVPSSTISLPLLDTETGQNESSVTETSDNWASKDFPQTTSSLLDKSATTEEASYSYTLMADEREVVTPSSSFPIFPTTTEPAGNSSLKRNEKKSGDWPIGFCSALTGKLCQANEICYEDSEGPGKCFCDRGYSRPLGKHSGSCNCPASKFAMEDGRCVEANVVYHFNLVPKEDGTMNDTEEEQLADAISDKLEDAFLLRNGNVTCEVTCNRLGKHISPEVNTSRTSHNNTAFAQLQCFVKFHTPPELLFSGIPEYHALADTLRSLLHGEMTVNSSSPYGYDYLGNNLILHNYCLEGEHVCDPLSTGCSFRSLDANLSCQCLEFHSRVNDRSCVYDRDLALAYFREVKNYQHWLWIVLYILVGVASLAIFGLFIVILLLKTRPVKYKPNQNGTRVPKVSISHYKNKIPRPKLTSPSLEQPTDQPSNPPNVAVASGPGFPEHSEAGNMIINPVYYPPLVKPVDYVPARNSPRSRIAASSPQTMSTFQRGQRLSPAPPPPPPPPPLSATSGSVGSLRAPLAGSESSIEGLFLSNGNYNTPITIRPASMPSSSSGAAGMIRMSPNRGSGLSGANRRPTSDHGGTIISLDDSPRIMRDAIHQHRHSALLNLIQSDPSPQSTV